jgi:hypothetical protein
MSLALNLQVVETTSRHANPRRFVATGYPHLAPMSGLFGKVPGVPRPGQSHPRDGGLTVAKIAYSTSDVPDQWHVRVEYGPRKELPPVIPPLVM